MFVLRNDGQMIPGGQPVTELAEKVKFLSNPSSYPPVTTNVDVRETHMSWVFLADDRVYKLKKPVKYPFLDFSTIFQRRFFCEEELRLNRRLARETYRVVVPLCWSRSEGLNLSGSGEPVDYLVQMKRLSAADMLDTRLRAGCVSRDDIGRVGKLMVGFYAACGSEVTDGQLYLKNLVEEQAVNRAILERPELGARENAAPILDMTDRELARLTPKVNERIAAGCMVEGHGDLRPEHVHLGEPVQVIDCLEFSRPMRILDPYDEINYLGLECAMLGASWIRPVLLDMLDAQLGRRPDGDLLALYSGFRAVLRARLCMAHLLEAVVPQPNKWKLLALSYIAMATNEFSSPFRSIR